MKARLKRLGELFTQNPEVLEDLLSLLDEESSKYDRFFGVRSANSDPKGIAEMVSANDAKVAIKDFREVLTKLPTVFSAAKENPDSGSG
jgi:hypothetical protein